ncbi:MAG: DUF2179 domain-containing protein [Bacteroidetes bacterium]|jgi:uncharacterized protein YebE (UPF0316 family)|nr:DUF2179 domain-containing protein [Bacteroidota bacterium]
MELFESILASPWGPALIFVLSAINVTFMTMKTIMAVRGRRIPAAVLGFCQMLVWLLAVGGALSHLDSVWHVLGYAGGYAAGNYVGVSLERRLAIGTSIVRAIFKRSPEAERQNGREAARRLREQDYAVTEVPARGWQGEVDVVNVVVPRKKVPQVLDTVRNTDPDAAVSVEGVQDARGDFPPGPRPPASPLRRWMPPWKKAA